jgi:flagellar hook-basal body complex protein FliE
MADLNIAPIAALNQSQSLKSMAPTSRVEQKNSFNEWLSKSLNEVDQLQQVADTASQKLINGESNDIHGTMIAVQKANVALELVMAIRNKVINAYEEVKRMQF